jgi:hypothetical protein
VAAGHLPIGQVAQGRRESEGRADRFDENAPGRFGLFAAEAVTDGVQRGADLRHLPCRPRVVRTDRPHPVKRAARGHQRHGVCPQRV